MSFLIHSKNFTFSIKEVSNTMKTLESETITFSVTIKFCLKLLSSVPSGGGLMAMRQNCSKSPRPMIQLKGEGGG